MSSVPYLGVCYYPEHWPAEDWAADAGKMADLGITQVRIGEFAWSRIEPSRDQFNWAWLDRAIDSLADAGLKVMLGTPTATPPKWLVDAHPEILSVDAQGHSRKFGSRRHYCFSSPVYQREAVRIVEAVASRYGAHPAVTAWQTDNEYGCHDTVRSYSMAAAAAFRLWLSRRYQTIKMLNEAWGTVFWSQEYASFDMVDLPNLTVTEPNPSHLLDFYRFSSDQVVQFNRLQTDIIRKHAPKATIVHNFMGFFFSFDHFAVGKDLDAVGWDSYPIGFLDVGDFSAADKARYMRQGHPDFAAFHHDLYRATGRNRWQVLEQQPGPVNWAPHNPAPLPGMVRLWSLEAFAHGAESVNYFRWRQAPFAQEQSHAGLELPNRAPAPGMGEARNVGADMEPLALNGAAEKADVAIIFSYDAHWLFEAHRLGDGWDYPQMVFDWYVALRQAGLNVDFISPDMPMDDYKLVIVGSLPIISEDFVARVKKSKAVFLFGPRSGSKTQTLTIPNELAPGLLQSLMPIRVPRAESFPAFYRLDGSLNGDNVRGKAWLDLVETDLAPLVTSDDGGLLFRHESFFYLSTRPGQAFLKAMVAELTRIAGVRTVDLPVDLRLRRQGDKSFLFNYGSGSVTLPDGVKPANAAFILGGSDVPGAGVSVWKTTSPE